MKVKAILIIAIAFVFCLKKTQAQEKTEYLIQFSGIIVTSDSLTPLSYVNIFIKNTQRAAIANYAGFFSLVVQRGDVLIFSSVGYKKAYYRVPDTLRENRYSIIQLMTSDTIHLPVTTVYPWPSKEDFREAFVKLRVPDDDVATIEKNIALITQRDLSAKGYNPDLQGMDAGMNFQNAIANYSAQQYYAGQNKSIQGALLNPFAWAEFFKAWKRGDFKRQQK